MGRMLLLATAMAAAAGALAPAAALAQGARQPAELARAEREVERLDELRSTLAGIFGEEGEEAKEETFRHVCRPVGTQVRRVARENGWEVEQVAVKYRNPAHRPDSASLAAFRLFEENPQIRGVWRRASRDGDPGYGYYRRITVEAACLACHGDRAARPDFVREGYPEDRAYGFEVGDLRGLYSVFVPDRP